MEFKIYKINNITFIGNDKIGLILEKSSLNMLWISSQQYKNRTGLTGKYFGLLSNAESVYKYMFPKEIYLGVSVMFERNRCRYIPNNILPEIGGYIILPKNKRWWQFWI